MRWTHVLMAVGALCALAACGKAELQTNQANRAEGSESSGGTDYHPETPAWFTSQGDTRAITTCYEMSPTFLADPGQGVDAKKIEGWIVDSFHNWQTYYQVTKHIKINGWTEHDDTSKPPRAPVFKLAGPPKAGCRGDEDLTFYFGIENDRVRAGRSKLYNPFAFAAVDAPAGNSTYGWTPGFIWVADTGKVEPKANVPMWTNYEGFPLRRILLHELGHVFGCTHVPGTIMADLSQWMLEKTQRSHSHRPLSYFSSEQQQRLLSIDEEYDLVTQFRDTETYRVSDGGSEHSIYQPPKLAELFQRLIGRAAVGSVEGTVTRKAVPSLIIGNDVPREGEGALQLTDSNGSYELPFTVLNLIGEVATSGRVFNFGGFILERSSRSYLGSLVLPSGSTLSVAINYNLDNARFEMIDLSTPQSPDISNLYPKRFLLRAN